MTKKEIDITSGLTILGALRLAFEAGSSYAIASHKDFVQIHEPREPVCEALLKRINQKLTDTEDDSVITKDQLASARELKDRLSCHARIAQDKAYDAREKYDAMEAKYHAETERRKLRKKRTS